LTFTEWVQSLNTRDDSEEKNIYICVCVCVWGWGSSVAGRSGDRIPVGTRFSVHPDRPCRPHSLLYNGYWVFPWGKVRPGRDADPSPPSIAVDLEEKSYTSNPLWDTNGPVTGLLYLYIYIYIYIYIYCQKLKFCPLHDLDTGHHLLCSIMGSLWYNLCKIQNTIENKLSHTHETQLHFSPTNI
jgi:hypothetical protein